jgi:hypothetical protein
MQVAGMGRESSSSPEVNLFPKGSKLKTEHSQAVNRCANRNQNKLQYPPVLYFQR